VVCSGIWELLGRCGRALRGRAAVGAAGDRGVLAWACGRAAGIGAAGLGDLAQEVAEEEELVLRRACRFWVSSSPSHAEGPTFTAVRRSGGALVVGGGGGTLLRRHSCGVSGAMRKLLKVSKIAFFLLNFLLNGSN